MQKLDPNLKCNNCGGDEFVIKYEFETRAIIQCKKCELMMLDQIPTIEDLKAVYDDNYFTNKNLLKPDVNGIYGYVDYISERAYKQKAYDPICKTLAKHLSRDSAASKPELLDYGCGLGFFIEVANAHGFNVTGIEFNQYAVDYVRKKYNFAIKEPSEFESDKKKFDVITMFDVLEHLNDPFGLIKNIHGRLHDNGLLLITTMDSLSLSSRILGKRLEDFRRIREHIFFFAKNNLKNLLIKNNFEILEVKHIGHAFQLKYLLARSQSISPTLSKLGLLLLNYFPFLSEMRVYVNPYTKILLIARKRKSP